MSSDGPIVFTSRSRIRPGRLDGLRAFLAAGAPMIEKAKPQTLGFLPYVDEASMTLTIVHVFADAAGFAAHVEGSDQRSDAAAEFIETAAIEIFGAPNEATVEAIRSGLPAGVPVDVRGTSVAAFLRLGR